MRTSHKSAIGTQSGRNFNKTIVSMSQKSEEVTLCPHRANISEAIIKNFMQQSHMTRIKHQL